MAEPCPVGCGRPCSLGREFCLACWRHVPIKNQRELYLLGQQLRYEQNNQGLQYAYQLALDRAIKTVPA